jgi:choline dehydrogenase-like flavoprotein
MTMVMTESQRVALAALVDTVVPAIERDDDPDGFWARTGSDVMTPVWLEAALSQLVPDDQAAGLGELLDGLSALGLASQPLAEREATLLLVEGMSVEAAIAVRQLKSLALLLSYALPDETGRSPFWSTLGYPGPLSDPPDVDRGITAYTPTDGEVLTADVVVVGSGAGGGVIAAEAAAAGRSVIVVEAGGNHDRRDFVQLELVANTNLYYRGGVGATIDGNVGLLAGSTLGGGTTVNWSNTVPTHAHVRRQWAQEHGLDGVDGAEFDEHLAAVCTRIKANDKCSELNGPHQRLTEAADSLGWSWHRALLNLDPDLYRYDASAYSGYGDQSGAKQGTLRTYLLDAVAHGARVLVRTNARRILVEDGRAAGIEAIVTDPATGATYPVTVRAPQVVVAAGALETPALLLRSGIGGPAVGRHLRLHPAAPLAAAYPEKQDWWSGPIHAAIVDEFADLHEGYGFLLEGLHFNIGQIAAGLPATPGGGHKEMVLRMQHMVSLIALVRDHGSGSVTIDATGEAVHTYPLDDELDREHFHQGLVAVARIHESAGADTIYPLIPDLAPWHRGDDFEAFLAQLAAVPIGLGGYYCGSAHQMGSARMGTDPTDSVADTRGELHDTPGVWIGDTSAFPTSSGTNPMLTCMALARRTAHRMLESTAT